MNRVVQVIWITLFLVSEIFKNGKASILVLSPPHFYCKLEKAAYDFCQSNWFAML